MILLGQELWNVESKGLGTIIVYLLEDKAAITFLPPVMMILVETDWLAIQASSTHTPLSRRDLKKD